MIMMKSNKNTTPVTSVLSLITSIRLAHHFFCCVFFVIIGGEETNGVNQEGKIQTQ